MVAVALIGLAAMAVNASRSRAVVIAPFDAPTSLAGSGYTGRTVAAGVLDTLAAIQAGTRAERRSRRLGNAWTQDVEVRLPYAGLSLGQLDRLLKNWLGQDIHVGGDLVVTAPGRVALTVRGDGVPAGRFEGALSELPDLARRAGEHLYGEAEPRLMGLYLLQQGRHADLDRFVASKIRAVDDRTKVKMLGNWASALVELDRPGEAVEKLRAAVRLDPGDWTRWDLLVETQMVLNREAASRTVAHVRRLIAATPAPRRPPPSEIQNILMIENDWTALREATFQQERKAAGGVMAVSNAAHFVDNAVYLHDWDEALFHHAQGDGRTPMWRARRLHIEARRRLEAGDAAGSARLFAAVRRLAAMDADIAYEFSATEGAVPLGRLGRRAEAAALFTEPLDLWTSIDKGLSLSARDEAASSDAVFAAAARRDPSASDLWEAWGRTALHRGDAATAEAKFRRTLQLAPRWADGWKGLGDALARQGRWREARQAYENALPLAPRWRQLRAALAEARRRTAAVTSAAP